MGRPADDAASRRILFGTDEALSESLPLRAGPLALALRDGALHDLGWHGGVAWHAVTFPYRDPDWWTPPFAVKAVAQESRDGGFRLEVRGSFASLPRLRTRLAVEAGADGRLRIAAEAVAERDLATNRTGLCLLLPTAAGGDRVEIVHDDGRVTRSTLPTLVAPWPPFTGIRTFRRRLASGRWAHAAFSGDSFEFEDQRNNADLSFKIYSRSNTMPRPYRLSAGVPVRQSLELWIERARLPSPSWRGARGEGKATPREGVDRAVPGRGTRGDPSLASDAGLPGAVPRAPFLEAHGMQPAWCRSRDRAGALPRVGLAVPIAGNHDMLRRVAAALRPAYLQASIPAGDLATSAADLAALATAGPPLRLELTLGESALSDADLAALIALRPEAVALFPSRPADVAALRRAVPDALVGGGTPHFFAQINRIDDLGPVDHLTFTVSPLVHGAEDEAVMACPRSIPGLAATLARRWPGLPVHLGPSALAMRASPLGRMPPCDGRARRAMAGDDPRARGLFGAAWALAVAAACAEAGLEAVTLMASEGPSGVAARGPDGIVWHPVSAVLALLGGTAEIVPSPVAPAPHLAALALRRDGARDLLLANLGVEPVDVALDGWAAGAVPAVLDEAALRGADPADGPPRFVPRPAASGRLTLASYAVAHLRDGPAPGRLGP